MEFFASCPAGFEHLLADELKGLGAAHVRPLKGQVFFEGPLRDAYRACLWSRLASRIVVVLTRCDATSSDELYEGMHALAWEDHLSAHSTFAVSAAGTNAQLRSTQFVAMRAKDAIADRLASRTGSRPSVDAKNPNLSIVVRIVRNRATIGIDLAGAPLFQRGYRQAAGGGSLRSDHACALLALGAWPTLCHNQEAAPVLLDVRPSSPTLMVEAALWAAGHAPGLPRLRWGFAGWLGHEPATWEELMDEARTAVMRETPAHLLAFEPAKGVLASVRDALRSTGVVAHPQAAASSPSTSDLSPSLLATDLSSLRNDDLAKEASILSTMAELAQSHTPHGVLAASRDHLPSSYLRQEPQTALQSFLGKEPLLLLSYGAQSHGENRVPTVTVANGQQLPVLIPASDQFAARLRKVARIRAKWARREDVTCYRVYDADLPDYALSIDLYQGTSPQTGAPTGERWLQISEYAAPKEVDPTLARSRLLDALSIAPAVLEVPAPCTFLRVRRHGKGGSQYAEEARPSHHSVQRRRPSPTGTPALLPGAHLIDEGGLTFEVNFSSRLDCGIFLDHRDTRALLREMAKQTKGSKRFLNLFAYTGTATCYAADGGMLHTTTVDLSRPSLEWARRNMERNGFIGKEHEFVQADVVQWIQEQRHTNHRWDLVFCDVPTFSNSRRMGKRSFDVQRDHTELLIGVSRLLTRSGQCVFSCNLRTFEPNVEKLTKAKVAIEDITSQTIPEDFSRNARIHRTYIIKRF